MVDGNHSTDLGEKALSTSPQLDSNLWVGLEQLLFVDFTYEKQLLSNWANPLSELFNANDNVSYSFIKDI